jgi:hypothetical protein
LADLPKFRKNLGKSAETTKLPLSHAIWTVNLDLAKKKLKETDNKVIWIFTNDDDPCKARVDGCCRRQSVVPEAMREEGGSGGQFGQKKRREQPDEARGSGRIDSLSP